MLAPLLGRGARAGADLDRLHRVDAHQRVGDVGVQPIEHRLTEARRQATGDDGDARTDRVPGRAHLPDEGLELGEALRIGTEERVLIGKGRVDGLEHERADLA